MTTLLKAKAKGEKKLNIYSKAFHNKNYYIDNICIEFFKENVLREKFFNLDIPLNYKLKQQDHAQHVQLDMLKFIERTLDILCRKYEYYANNFNDSLKTCEKNLDEERKDKKNRGIQEIQTMKQEVLRTKIEERNNKVYNVGYRKVAIKLKPIDKIKKVVIVDNEEKNDDFNDLIMGFDSDEEVV